MPSYQYYFIIVISDAIDFHAPVKLGHIIHLTGRVTFTSNKSMEIEVVVDAKDYLAGKEISRPLHCTCSYPKHSDNDGSKLFNRQHDWIVMCILFVY